MRNRKRHSKEKAGPPGEGANSAAENIKDSFKAQKNHSESCDSKSLRALVFEVLRKYPTMKAKDICDFLKIDYKMYGKQVNQRRYEWMHSERLQLSGLGSKCSTHPDEQHHVRAMAYVPECLGRKERPEVTEAAVRAGWERSRNKNRVLIWNKHRGSYGRIEWWETGKVSVYVRAPQHMGRVKRLVTLAFYENGLIFDTRLFFAFVDAFKWAGSHDVFHTGVRLPYKKITAYKSIGLDAVVLGDRTHPDATEFHWAYPEWAERLEFLFQRFLKEISSRSESPDPKAKDLKSLRRLYE